MRMGEIMTVTELKALSLSELREAYRRYLESTARSKNTIQISVSDAFYIWRKASSNRFWEIVESAHFEQEGREALLALLPKQPDGAPSKNIQGYLTCLRRFRRFALDRALPMPAQAADASPKKKRQSATGALPKPCIAEVEKYLNTWATMENYTLQEAALNKLFFNLAPNNACMEDVLLKASVLNDFYSTNIFSIFPVAKHILSLNIDRRLRQGDPTLVDVIKVVEGRSYYSFASKYCSHHNPLAYPIYDSYVDKVLRYFRDADGFCAFDNDDLKQYDRFKKIVLAFRAYYQLEHYTLKEIDQYLWQLGKEFFPKNFYTKKKTTIS